MDAAVDLGNQPLDSGYGEAATDQARDLRTVADHTADLSAGASDAAGDPGRMDATRTDTANDLGVAGDVVAADADSPPGHPYPMHIFFDWSGRVAVGYAPDVLSRIAARKVAIWPATSVLSAPGQTSVTAIREQSPDFVALCSLNPMFYSATEPGHSWLAHRLWEIGSSNPMRHVDGTAARAGPDGQDTVPPLDMWLSPWPPEAPFAYNRTLLVDYIDGLEAAMVALPGVCDGLLFRELLSQPVTLPVQQAIHGAYDLDQDGVGFPEDPEERSAWIAWQRDIVIELRARMGAEFVIVTGGRMTHPDYYDYDLPTARASNGTFFTLYPATPGMTGPATVEQLYQIVVRNEHPPAGGRRWNILALSQYASEPEFNLTRISSLIFHAMYCKLGGNDEVLLEDPHDLLPGELGGELVVERLTTTSIYSRLYEHGLASLITDDERGVLSASFSQE